MSPALPYWRLSGYYWFFFAALGAFVPYLPVYLHSLNLSPAQIGELIGIGMAARIIAPYWWAWLADHHGRRMVIVRWTSWFAFVTFFGLFLRSDYWWVFLCLSTFGFFWNAGLPQFEAVTLAYLQGRTHFYSRIRMWGSIGFIVTVVGLGMALESHPPIIVLWVLAPMYGGLWLVTLTVHDQTTHHPEHPVGSPWTVLRRRPVIALLLTFMLIQFSHGPYYTFYSIYLEDHGYRPTIVGWLWALGVIAEVGIFLVMDRLMARYSLGTLLIASLLLAAVRWILLGFLVHVPVVVVSSQLLHAATFGVFHAVAIQWIHQLFPGRLQGRGMALYSSLSFGLGTALGALVSGYTWASLGPQATFTWAALAALAGVGLARYAMKHLAHSPG